MTDRGFETPAAAEEAFYRAFNTIDLDLMEAVWTNGDRPLCIHPGSGLLKGKPAIMQSWNEIFSNSEPPVIEYRFLDGFATEELVIHVVEERIRPRGKPPDAANRVLATNVFLLEGGSWYLAEHHASLPLMGPGTARGNERPLH